MILKGYEKEAPPKRGEASGDAAFSGAENAHARHARGWQIVRFRAACAGRSRMERMEISAKMDAEMASRIIMMAVFSEQAKRAQETCAKRAVCIRFMVLRMVRSPFCGVFSEMVQAYHRRAHFSRGNCAREKTLYHATKFCGAREKRLCDSHAAFPAFSVSFPASSTLHLPLWAAARVCRKIGQLPGRCPVSRHERRFVHTKAQAGPLY